MTLVTVLGPSTRGNGLLGSGSPRNGLRIGRTGTATAGREGLASRTETSMWSEDELPEYETRLKPSRRRRVEREPRPRRLCPARPEPFLYPTVAHLVGLVEEPVDCLEGDSRPRRRVYLL